LSIGRHSEDLSKSDINKVSLSKCNINNADKLSLDGKLQVMYINKVSLSKCNINNADKLSLDGKLQVMYKVQ